MAYKLIRNKIKVAYEYFLTHDRFITGFCEKPLDKHPELKDNPLPPKELIDALEKNGKDADGLYLFKLTDEQEPKIIQETERPTAEKQIEIDNTRLEKALQNATIKFYKSLANGTLDTLPKIKQFFINEINNY